jgi:AcrR family transcriptional regulator
VAYFTTRTDRMTPPPQTATRRSDGAETRREILGVAHRLFTTIGYRKTTVADIAAELGMSPANVYRFFESKKDINESVAELVLDEISDALEAIARSGEGSAADRLAAVLRALARLSDERFMTNKRMYDMVEAAMAESWSVCERYIERVSTVFAALVEEGRSSGEFDVPDAAVGALCVHSSMVCFCHPAMIAQSADQPKPSVDEIVAFVLRGLGAAPAR